jgi:hypothetical protein
MVMGANKKDHLELREQSEFDYIVRHQEQKATLVKYKEQIEKIVQENPNNTELGQIVREYVLSKKYL